MSRITIHIGLHKTGTTYLQDNLFKNSPEISVIRGWYSHRQLMNASAESNIIISDESISGRLWHKNYRSDFYANIEKIKTIYGNPKIIFGIRNQESLIPSVYKQYLHNEGFESFNHLFNNENKGIRKHEDFLIMPKINYLKENFTDVFIYSQEGLFKRQNEFLTALKEFLELNHKIKVPSNGTKNIGVNTVRQVKLLKRLNKFSFYLKKIHPKINLYSKIFRKLKITPRNICQNLLKNMGSKKFEISESSKEFIKQYYKSDWEEASNFISF